MANSQPCSTADLELALQPAVRVLDRRSSGQDYPANLQCAAENCKKYDRDDLLSLLGLGEQSGA